MKHVIACIDGSALAAAVCDCASWASLRLRAQLTFLHVLDKRQYPVEPDLSGNLGLGGRESLLDELATLDGKRAKLAMEQGRIMLDTARERALAAGVVKPAARQRHGDLLESLQGLESDMRLLVMGRQGESSSASQHVGSQLENVIRVMQRPVLITPASFAAPQSALLAFDAGPTTCKGVEVLAGSQLLQGMPIHLLMVGSTGKEALEKLEWARQTLADAGYQVQIEVRTGDVEEQITAYQKEHSIDLLVMGAYGHSRIRQFLIGSITTSMLRRSKGPLLLLR